MAKLGSRLKAIANQVTFRGQPIWDCCCDHGYLGLYLLGQPDCISSGSKVHFVDCVDEIIARLNARLRAIPSIQGRWQSHCIDVADLPLTEQGGLAHTIIIAGVGGEMVADMITALNQQFAHLTLDYIVCPVHYEYEMRCRLMAQGMSLFAEQLIKENGRFYEVIHLGRHGRQPLTAIGQSLWQPMGSVQIQYLDAKIKHYQRLRLGGQDTAGIISAYQALLK
ncbi:tRNA (adenine(22)-N(1))-methyltransferase [Motilimonas sp. KMU-193]|uniref:tRNA (adenine(22)-N(1))-methyltransferase n=1 Tax=Motilimonas sp. KMU-193 TaxID=3388668 RepID=UPI00396B0547